MLSWTDFNINSVHENGFRGFCGHFLLKIAQPIRKEVKVGRNDPCPCGSGKKYKNCHGRLEAAE
jgi:preprotein translocase subunit SecA